MRRADEGEAEETGSRGTRWDEGVGHVVHRKGEKGRGANHNYAADERA